MERFKKKDRKVMFVTGAICVVIVIFALGWILLFNKPEKQERLDMTSTDDFGTELNISEYIEEFVDVEVNTETTQNQELVSDEILKESEVSNKDKTENNSTVNRTDMDVETSEKNDAGKIPSKTPEMTETNSSVPDKDTETQSESSSETEKESSKEDYKVSVKSKGGYKLYNVTVSVYEDDGMKALVTEASTDGQGEVKFQLSPKNSYVFKLSNLPEGYIYEDRYLLNDTSVNVVLESSLISNKDILQARLRTGDVMYDFTVPSAKGGDLTLSELLKKNDLVVLNFWYVNCEFCVKEFPYMEEAYHVFSSKMKIIALDPFDSMDSVKTFLSETPLDFDVATCSDALPNVFGISEYPYTIIIDKYGVIREMKKGAILETSGFVSLFGKYLR